MPTHCKNDTRDTVDVPQVVQYLHQFIYRAHPPHGQQQAVQLPSMDDITDTHGISANVFTAALGTLRCMGYRITQVSGAMFIDDPLAS